MADALFAATFTGDKAGFTFSLAQTDAESFSIARSGTTADRRVSAGALIDTKDATFLVPFKIVADNPTHIWLSADLNGDNMAYTFNPPSATWGLYVDADADGTVSSGDSPVVLGALRYGNAIHSSLAGRLIPGNYILSGVYNDGGYELANEIANCVTATDEKNADVQLAIMLQIGVVSGCPSDVDDGSMTGTPDDGVTIEDLLFYLSIFATGDIRADIDDGSGTGTHDGGVTIEDLLYFLSHFAAGC